MWCVCGLCGGGLSVLCLGLVCGVCMTEHGVSVYVFE